MSKAIPDMKRPTRLSLLSTVKGFRTDPLGLFARIAELPDGVATAGVPRFNILFVTNPDHVHRVLRENHQNYDKNALIYNNARPFLGDGLPAHPGGEEWRRRRRMVQPAFHRSNVRLVTDVTSRYLADAVVEWNSLAERGQSVDMALELATLTMRIACRVLFDVDVAEAQDIARRFGEISEFAVEFLTRQFPPLFVPTRANRAFHENMRQVHKFVDDVVRSRQAGERRRGDLLDLLIDAVQDPSGDLTPIQLRSELISMFFAGHDTLAQTLAWAVYLVAKHPEVDTRLHEEVATVLGDRPATAADLPNLPYVEAVVREAMRLYPVSWTMMRRAIGPDVIAGYLVRPGTLVTWSPYIGNRDPRIWADPEAFRPERFLPEQSAGRCRHAVVPFGEGPRACVGTDFAMAEAGLILATFVQHYRVELAAGRSVRPAAGITLHPDGGLWGTLRPRNTVRI